MYTFSLLQFITLYRYLRNAENCIGKESRETEAEFKREKQVQIEAFGCLQKQEATQVVKVLRPGVPAPVSTKAYIFPDRPSAPHRGDDKVYSEG